MDGRSVGAHCSGELALGSVPGSWPEPGGDGGAVKFLERNLKDPVRLTRMKRWFYAGLAALALGEVVVPRLFEPDRAHFRFEDLPAWGSLYGLVSCVAIIVVSKILGKLWLMRPESYYDS